MMVWKRRFENVAVSILMLAPLAGAKENTRGPRAFAISYSFKTPVAVHGLIAVLPRSEVPAKGETDFEIARFVLPFAPPEQKTLLEVFNIAGQRIYWAEAQDCQVSWDGRDQFHRPVPYGLYPFILRAETASHQAPNSYSGRLFEDVTERALPVDSSRAREGELGDLDGDGDLDLVVAHFADYGRQPQVYINNGAGVFTDETASRLPALLTITNDVDLADVDNDGDQDIYLANTAVDTSGDPAFSDNLLINDGSGRFQDERASRVPQTWIATQNVAFGDMDNDGDADLLVTHLTHLLNVEDSSRVILLFNDGQGFFAPSTRCPLDASKYFPFDLALVDVNHDSYLDLVLANMPLIIMDDPGNPVGFLSGQNAIFINDGQGHFTDETASRNPTLIEDSTVAIAPGDVDRDGDMDLFFANVGFLPEETMNRLLINNGEGFFTDETVARLPAETSTWNNDADMADFDGNGAVDIFMPSVEPEAGGNAPDLLYLNDGLG